MAASGGDVRGSECRCPRVGEASTAAAPGDTLLPCCEVVWRALAGCMAPRPRGRHDETAWLEARALSLTSDLCQRRMQAAADLLLLTSDPRPVRTCSLSVFGESVARCRDTVAARSKGLVVLLRDLAALVQPPRPRYTEARVCVEELCGLVVSLTECCAHAGYLLAVLQEGSSPEQPGPVDTYLLCRAAADVEYTTTLLRAHRLPTISSLQLTDMSICTTESASVMTNCCLVAADEAPDDTSRDQFRLCVKSVSAAANTFCASIRCLKDQPCDRNYKACQVFGEALATTCGALAVFATQDARLTGTPARLSTAGSDALRRVLGACMSVVSPCVLACSLAGGSLSAEQHVAARLRHCCDAVARGSQQLVHALQPCADDTA